MEVECAREFKTAARGSVCCLLFVFVLALCGLWTLHYARASANSPFTFYLLYKYMLWHVAIAMLRHVATGMLLCMHYLILHIAYCISPSTPTPNQTQTQTQTQKILPLLLPIRNEGSEYTPGDENTHMAKRRTAEAGSIDIRVVDTLSVSLQGD